MSLLIGCHHDVLCMCIIKTKMCTILYIFLIAKNMSESIDSWPCVCGQEHSVGTGNSDAQKLYLSSQNIDTWYNRYDHRSVLKAK